MEEKDKEKEENPLGEVKEGMKDEKKEETKEGLGKEAEGEKKPFSHKEEMAKANEELLKSQLALERAEKEKWMNKYYQELADIQNLRKDIQKDNQTLLEYRAMPFVEKLIPFFNSMDMCSKNEPKDPAVKSWIEGIHMAYRQLWSSLESEGFKEIDPKKGEAFDPRYMEAMQVVEGEKDNLVDRVLMKGYRLKERLVSPAMVAVTKAKKDEEKKDDKTKDEKKEEAKK